MVFPSSFTPIAVSDLDVHSFVFGQVKDMDATYLIDSVTGNEFSYRQVLNDIDRFAAGLYHNLAFKKWDVVGIYSQNHLDFAVAVHGTIKAGGTVSPANHTYTTGELANQLKDCGAKYLITNSALLPNAIIAAEEAGIPSNHILLFAGPETEESAKFKTLQSVYSEAELPPVTFTQEELQNNPAYLCYSSGTTGRSKGVQTTHRNIIANVQQFVAAHDQVGEPIKDETWVAILPLYHIYGMFTTLHVAPYTNSREIIVPKFELVQFLTILSKYGVTVGHIVPPIAVAFAKHPIVDKFTFPKLRVLLSASAPLGGDVTEQIKERLGIPVVQAYGMTELSPCATITCSKNIVSGGCGILVPNMEARLVDSETGLDVGEGQPGELWLRGPNVMKGYHNNEEATKETIDSEGWLHTGDVAVIDKDGQYFIVDRIKELIKYKGLQVPPAELEALLLTHPAIADSAVIPTPNLEAGELPRAYVVLKPGMTATESEIQAFVGGKVAQHKKLRGGVVFVDAIPKAASGKILRRVLRAREAEERKNREP